MPWLDWSSRTGVLEPEVAAGNGNGLADDGLAPFLTEITNELGEYSFVNVPNWDVVIEQVDPPGAISTGDVDASPFDSQAGLTLTGGQVWTFMDFWDNPENIDSILADLEAERQRLLEEAAE